MKKKLLALIIALVTLVTSFAVISFAADNTDAIADQIVLSFGKDETERNLAWFSEKSAAGEVRLAEASKVVGGVFPTEYKTFSATSKASDFESGKYSKKATITGLSENTRYAYVFAVGTEVSDIYYFDVGSFGDFSFVFISDPQLQKVEHGDKWRTSLSKITDNLGVDLIVSGGDQVTTANDIDLYNAFLIEEMAGVTFAPTVGPGHEESPLYSEHYNLPNLSSKYGSNTTSSDYWYVYNNVLFINLNSSDRSAFSNGEHEAFIKEAMAANPDVDWNVVVTHYSLFTTGRHTNEMLTYRNAFADVLTELGVDLVLSAHDHVYVRTHMMNGEELSNDLVVGDVAYAPEGTLFVESNSCTGTKFYDQELFGAEWVAKDDYKNKCAIKFEVTETTLSMKSYYLDGLSVFDTFTIEKEAPANIDAELKLEGVDVTLTDGALLNFYVSYNELIRGIDNAEFVTKNGKQCYKITAEVAAKEMGDEITVQLKSGDTLIGDPFTYSVKEYADGILNGDYDAVTKAMTQALLNYGAATQNYFGYKIDTLVGTPVSDISKLAGATVGGDEVSDADGVFIGASLVLEGTMKLRFYFEGNNLSVTVDGNAAKAENKEEFCYVDVRVFPNDIDKIFEVKCGSATIKYSVLNYLKNNADDAELAEMVASIYEYGVAAKSYLDQHCTHEDAEFKITRLPTLFSEGSKSAYCERCGKDVTLAVEKAQASVSVVTTTVKEDLVIKDYVQIKEIIGDKHFYPTTEDPDGNDLYVEFSMLFNSSMNNFKGSNITFPGIYGENSLASDKGAPAFWYYIKTADGITAGKYDDWTSNAVNKNDPAKYYNNMAKPVEFDGWHRFGIKFHQNTDVDIANNEVSYTMTVTMYIDGVRVYEAELDAMNTYKTNGHYLRLYTAEIVDGNVVYKDNVDGFASFYRYTAYVADANNPAYFVTADKYITVGDGFVLDVERVNNPESATIEVEDGVEFSAKAYYKVK